MPSCSPSPLEVTHVPRLYPNNAHNRRRDIPRLYLDLPRRKPSNGGGQSSTASSTTFPVSPSPLSACCYFPEGEGESSSTKAMSASIFVGIKSTASSPCSPRQRLVKPRHLQHSSTSPKAATTPEPTCNSLKSPVVLGKSNTFTDIYSDQASQLRDTDHPDVLTVQIGSENHLPPLWLIDPDQNLCEALTKRMNTRTVYSISTKGLDLASGRFGGKAVVNLGQLAEWYIERAVEQVQPFGPYVFLGGHGIGGAFARELGAALSARWERSLEKGNDVHSRWTVNVLLVDTINPTMERATFESKGQEGGAAQGIHSRHPPQPFSFGPPVELLKARKGTRTGPLIEAKVGLLLLGTPEYPLNGWTDERIAPGLAVTLAPTSINSSKGSKFVEYVADWAASSISMQ